MHYGLPLVWMKISLEIFCPHWQNSPHHTRVDKQFVDQVNMAEKVKQRPRIPHELQIHSCGHYDE